MTRTRGQRSLFNGAYIQKGHPTGKLGGPASYYYHLKETQLSTWSVSTSPPPTMKQNTKN